MIRFGPAGAADSFAAMGYKKTAQMPEYLEKMGLTAFEYQCGRGVRITDEAARALGEGFRQRDIAVSLHAPSDALRDELVPMNKRFNTTQVLDAAHDYFLSSKRRVSIEYALMRGINDQAEHARLLAKRLNHYGDDWAHVNPIPLNPIEGSRWTASKPEDEQQFLDILHHAGITATLRDTRGSDIDGACGQLAAKTKEAFAA